MKLIARFLVEIFIFVLGFFWLFKANYPTDLRRVWLIVFALCYFFWPYAKRSLYISKAIRNCLTRMNQRSVFRRGLFWSFTAFLVLSGALRALALQYTLFDTGIFSQLLWNISQGNGFISSVSQTDSFLKDHLVWSLSALAPVYWLASNPVWTSKILLGVLPGAITGALLALTFAAWIFLAENYPDRHRRRVWIASIVILGAWGFQPFWGNLLWGLHENLWGAALLSWSLALYLTGRMGFVGVLLLLSLASGAKETYLLVVAFTAFGLAMYEKKKHPKRLIGFLSLGLFCLLTFIWYSQSDRDPSKNYFVRYFGHLGENLHQAISTLIFHPVTALSKTSLRDTVVYVLALLFPLGILPCYLIFKRSAVSWIWLGVIPSVGAALISIYPGLRDPNMHYFFEVVPLLGILTVLSLFQLRIQSLIRFGIVWLILCWGSLESQPISDLLSYFKSIPGRFPLILALNQIPQSNSVMIDDPMGTWTSARKQTSVWGNRQSLKNDDKGPVCPDYYVFKAGEETTTAFQDKLNEINDFQKWCNPSGAMRVPKSVKYLDGGFGGVWIYTTVPVSSQSNQS